MAKPENLNSEEINADTGGITSYSQVDPKTGEIVIYSDTGVEIGRLPAGSLSGPSN